MTTLTSAQQHRQQLRQQVRSRRNALSASEQAQASTGLLTQLLTLERFNQAKRVGLYLANEGELDLSPVVQLLWQRGVDCYLPVLHPFSKGHLLFLHYQRDSLLVNNRYGIAEPVLDVRNIMPVAELDLILCPLVAFDANGNRLGMGGGFYDRTLSRWRQPTSTALLPIGIAHCCQQVEQVPTEAWDIPLPIIATPAQIWQWQNG